MTSFPATRRLTALQPPIADRNERTCILCLQPTAHRSGCQQRGQRLEPRRERLVSGDEQAQSASPGTRASAVRKLLFEELAREPSLLAPTGLREDRALRVRKIR